jgi:CRP-like cAMP-binding protein
MAGSLRKVLYFLGILDDTDIEWMIRAGTRRKLHQGTPIIREGHATEALYFVLDGELAVTSARTKGEIARVLAGEVVGEVSFVDSRPPSATVTAVLESVVGAVPVAALEEKLGKDPAFAKRFYKSIAVALANRLRASHSMGYRPARGLELEDDSDEIAPELLDSMSLAGMRFTEMQRRPWGA